MKKIIAITVVLVGLISFTGISQNDKSTDVERPYIEVVGIAEKEVVPDEIFIAITIRERQEGRVKITIEQQDSDLKTGLQSIGVSLNELSLSDAQSDLIKVRWKTKDVITKKEYILKVTDAATVGKVFEKLDELKILDAYISRVSHSKLVELKKEIRILAIKAAKNKADYLLEAINEETGRALIVLEQSSSQRNNNSFANVRGARSEANYYYIDGMKVTGSSEVKKVVIQFEKIKLSASIYVKFEIK